MYEPRGRVDSTSPRNSSALPPEYTFAVSMKLMPTSNAFATQASAWSSPTPPPYVSQEPRQISETWRSLEPSCLNCIASTVSVSVRRAYARAQRNRDRRVGPRALARLLPDARSRGAGRGRTRRDDVSQRSATDVRLGGRHPELRAGVDARDRESSLTRVRVREPCGRRRRLRARRRRGVRRAQGAVGRVLGPALRAA